MSARRFHAVIFGGTGNLGSHLTKRLLAQKRDIRLVMRTPSKAQKVFGVKWPNMDVFPGSYFQMSCEDIRKSIEGCDNIVLCAGGGADSNSRALDLFRFGKKKGSHPANFVEFTRKLAAQAADTGTRLIYVSTYAVDRPWNPVAILLNTVARNSIKYHLECERAIRETPDLDYIVVRPVGFEHGGTKQPENPRPELLRVGQGTPESVETDTPNLSLGIEAVLDGKDPITGEELNLGRKTFHLWNKPEKAKEGPTGWETIRPDKELPPLPKSRHQFATTLTWTILSPFFVVGWLGRGCVDIYRAVKG